MLAVGKLNQSAKIAVALISAIVYTEKGVLTPLPGYAFREGNIQDREKP